MRESPADPLPERSPESPSAPASARSPVDDDAEPRPIAIASLLLFLPFVVALSEVLSSADVTTRMGDEAPFEARLLTLLDPPALVGPYSRHVWSHPGPLSLWLFGLPYLALGRAPLVLALVALALSAASVASIVRSLRVLTAHPAARAWGLACTAVLVAHTSAALDPSGLAVTWNPACTLLPFAALVLLAAELGQGKWAIAPFLVLVHAFVAQTHVAYVLPATLACALGLVLARRARRPAEERTGLARAGLALGVLWAPVVIDQIFVSGNLGRIVAFFLEERVGTPLEGSAALVLFAWRATEPFRTAIDVGAPPVGGRDPLDEVGGGPLAASTVAVLALVATLAVAIFLRRRERDDGGFVLSLLALVLLVVGAPTILRVDTPEWPYLTWWIGALAVLGTMAAGLALLPRGLEASGERIAHGVCLAVIALVGLRTAATIAREGELGAERARRESEGVVQLFPALESIYACRPETRLTVAEGPLWGVLGASVVHLGRGGVRAHVSPDWEFMFGPGYAGGDPASELVITGGDDHACPAVERGWWLRLADCTAKRGEPAPRGEAVTLPLTVWEAHGITGDPALVTDGVQAAEGDPWNAPGAVVLADTSAAITLGLPVARLSRLAITSDDNDVLRVEQTRDGERWEPLVDLTPTHQWGQRTHEVALEGGLVLRAIRVSPVSGDGAYSISEIRVEGEREALRVIDAPGLAGPVAALTDGVVPEPEVAFDDPRVARFDGPLASITVELPAIPIAALALTATARRGFRVEASIDGQQYQEIGRIAPTRGDGLATRRFYLDQDVLASHVRLTALEGQGPVHVAELSPVRAPGVTIDVGLQAARPALASGFSDHVGDEPWAWIVGRRAEVTVPWPAELSSDEGLDVLVSLAPSRAWRVPARWPSRWAAPTRPPRSRPDRRPSWPACRPTRSRARARCGSCSRRATRLRHRRWG